MLMLQATTDCVGRFGTLPERSQSRASVVAAGIVLAGSATLRLDPRPSGRGRSNHTEDNFAACVTLSAEFLGGAGFGERKDFLDRDHEFAGIDEFCDLT